MVMMSTISTLTLHSQIESKGEQGTLVHPELTAIHHTHHISQQCRSYCIVSSCN
jgi:hypothetical protein